MARRSRRSLPIHPNVHALQHALANSDGSGLRNALRQLSAEERAILEASLGGTVLRNLERRASRGVRGLKRGKVVLLHGTMGCHLASVGAGNDTDRIWLNLWRLFIGRMRELELDANGAPANPAWTIATDGQIDLAYLPMFEQLDREWEVLAHCYDWRWDIDDAARALAAKIRQWGGGQPVHVVAHSMGGLVTRRMLQLEPELWKSMDDSGGRKRGGRLVMLGTPNRGSYNGAQALSGHHAMVNLLAAVDIAHNKLGSLRIFDSFLGTYQLLPAPYIDIHDDHARLYDIGVWGDAPVSKALLDRARLFHETLRPVLSPERMLYIAGYGQKTVNRIAIGKPGEFTFGESVNGDGTVPHELGLLEGVKTYFVPESHMNLCKNEAVLGAIGEVLAAGTTDALSDRAPAAADRGVALERRLVAGEELTRVPDDMAAAFRRAGATARRRGAPTQRDWLERANLERRILERVLGTGGVEDRQPIAPAETGSGAAKTPRPGRVVKKPPLRVELHCADLRAVEADVYAVGHYIGVPPLKAEWALDVLVSGSERDEDLVLTELTRRGVLRGELGEVNFFPFANDRRRFAAIAGMGRVGEFGASDLRILAQQLAIAAGRLPKARSVCSVLIGSGDGNLSAEASVRGLIQGMVDAVQSRAIGKGIEVLRLAERDVEKANKVCGILTELCASDRVKSVIDLRFDGTVHPGPGRRVNDAVLGDWLSAAARTITAPSGRAQLRRVLEPLLKNVRDGDLEARASLEDVLWQLTSRETAGPRRPTARVAPAPHNVDDLPIPTRVSFSLQDGRITASAISNRATVSERVLGMDLSLVDEVVARMVGPDFDDATAPGAGPDVDNALSLGSTLARLIVPRDFRELLEESDRALIFEVDRDLARVQWEMLSLGVTRVGSDEPISIRRAVARQLRTTYSPPPRPEPRGDRARLKALVVGDPGDPDLGHSLPGAQREAEEVAAILRKHDLDVELMIGAPLPNGKGPVASVAAAGRLDVLDRLMRGDIDVLHYCGHGDFDEKDPSRVGWLFKGGLLTANELDRVDRAPDLVVANACLSAKTSLTVAGGRRAHSKLEEARLLPSLADAFFSRGVHDYVGTAWEVDDEGAVVFARNFYEGVFGTSRQAIGDALNAARRELFENRNAFGALWAAYQHYGDPTLRIAPAGAPASPEASGGTLRGRRRRRR